MVSAMNASQFAVLALALAAVALVLVVALFVGMLNLRRQHAAHNAQANAALTQAQAQLEAFSYQLDEQQSRSLVQSKHLQQLQTLLTQQENQLREVKQQDPSMRLYQRAAELVRQGASVDEIMESCDIPRAEAELIITIHKH